MAWHDKHANHTSTNHASPNLQRPLFPLTKLYMKETPNHSLLPQAHPKPFPSSLLSHHKLKLPKLTLQKTHSSFPPSSRASPNTQVTKFHAATTQRPRPYKKPKTPPYPTHSKRTKKPPLPRSPVTLSSALTTYHHPPPCPDPRTAKAGTGAQSAAFAAAAASAHYQPHVGSGRQHRWAYRVLRRCRRDRGCCGAGREERRGGSGRLGRRGGGGRAGRRRGRGRCRVGK